MKNQIVSLTALCLTSSLFAKSSVKPAIATGEERIRKAIDNICGDTWCEGDFRFVFKNVVVDKDSNSFVVNFTMTPYIDDETVLDDETVTATIKPGADVSCTIKGHSNADAIVSKSGSLDWGVYETLSKCVNSLESKLVK